jgi:hypothetical protein
MIDIGPGYRNTVVIYLAKMPLCDACYYDFMEIRGSLNTNIHPKLMGYGGVGILNNLRINTGLLTYA